VSAKRKVGWQIWLVVKIFHFPFEEPRERLCHQAYCLLFSCRLLLPTAYCFLLPGLTAVSPRWQASQSAGSTAETLSVASAIRGTPTSALPDERSMIDAAATTLAPLAAKAATVSRVEPPVVTTSSTTNTLSLGETEKPLRKTILPFSRSVQMKRAPSARATSCPIMRPPIAGETTV